MNNSIFQEKLLWGAILLLGVALSIGGLFGVWLQGEFWKVFVQATESEVQLALTLPVMFNFAGGVLITSTVCIGPFAKTWTTTSRIIFLSIYVVANLVVFHFLGGLAAKLINPILH